MKKLLFQFCKSITFFQDGLTNTYCKAILLIVIIHKYFYKNRTVNGFYNSQEVETMNYELKTKK